MKKRKAESGGDALGKPWKAGNAGLTRDGRICRNNGGEVANAMFQHPMSFESPTGALISRHGNRRLEQELREETEIIDRRFSESRKGHGFFGTGQNRLFGKSRRAG